MTDVVYILGKNSCWQDNELRYSLRSIEKHLKNYNRVFVVGEFPSFLNKAEVTHIPCDDGDRDKAGNIKKKILAAAHSSEISENFLFFNDDYFLVADIDAPNYPYYWKCDLSHTLHINNTIYKKHVESTIKVLSGRGFQLKNFDTHKPIIYNKERLKEVIYDYDWSIGFGYIMRSLYCNTLRIEGQFLLDNKLVRPMTVQSWQEAIKGIDCFSVEDQAVNFLFHKFIGDVFPDKSRFEV